MDFARPWAGVNAYIVRRGYFIGFGIYWAAYILVRSGLTIRRGQDCRPDLVIHLSNVVTVDPIGLSAHHLHDFGFWGENLVGLYREIIIIVPCSPLAATLDTGYRLNRAAYFPYETWIPAQIMLVPMLHRRFSPRIPPSGRRTLTLHPFFLRTQILFHIP